MKSAHFAIAVLAAMLTFELEQWLSFTVPLCKQRISQQTSQSRNRFAHLTIIFARKA
jgi:hypothetical protein